MGQGLIIGKEIIEKHGGKIRIKGEKRKGPDILFTLKNTLN
jgi:signal transduction histidine kinase